MSQITDLLDIPLRTGLGSVGLYARCRHCFRLFRHSRGLCAVNGKRTSTSRSRSGRMPLRLPWSTKFARDLPVPIPGSEDIKITYEFDQSQYVRDALISVLREGISGAILTGLILLFFLRDWRSSS